MDQNGIRCVKKADLTGKSVCDKRKRLQQPEKLYYHLLSKDSRELLGKEPLQSVAHRWPKICDKTDVWLIITSINRGLRTAD